MICRSFVVFVYVLMVIDSSISVPAIEGNYTMSGDAGDYITQGRTYTYSTENGDILSVNTDSSLRGLGVSIEAYNSDNWSLNLQVPSGRTLEVGEYLNATRWPFNLAGPGVSVSGNGRGCNTLTGSFVVVHALFGPNGEVNRFEATFEQHCEGGVSALRGSINIGWTYCDESCDEACGNEPCNGEDSSGSHMYRHYGQSHFMIKMLLIGAAIGRYCTLES